MRRIPYIFPVFIFFCAFISWTPSWMSASLHAEVISNNQPQQLEVPAHVPNRIIVKFKDDADVGVVANQLKGTQQGFSAMTNNANLDKLSRKYKVKKVRKLFGDFSDQTYTATAGQISINQAQASRRTLKNKVRTAFEKTGKTHRNLSEERLDKITSFLDSTYVIEVDSDTDMYEVSRQFASDPNVEYAHPDYTMEIYYVPDDPYYHSYGSWLGDYDDLWGLKKINTEDAWDLTQGEGVVVAVVDTGLDLTHADIAENVWTNEGEIPGNGIDDDQNGYIDDVHGWDFGDQDNDVDDFQGHGTHVAGTIAAVGNNSEGIIGVAPKSKIMPVKGFSSYGGGTTSSLAAAIVYAAMNGADVISNSWGCNPQCPSDPVAEQAVKIAHDLGAVVVFAAGNSTKDVKLFSPQNMKETITVSATDRFDAKAGYSNFGLGVDVGAPGGGEADNILSLRASGTGFQHLVVGERYYRARGTSMATPHVSGLAALILSRHPEFTNEEVASIIKHTADDISDPGFDIQSGYGRINAYSAVQQDGPFLYDFSNVEVDMANQEIKVYGSVYHQDFNHYKIEYAPSMGETIPTEFLDFGVALENNGGQEVRNNLMATLDIQSLDSGQYYLRGTVELNDGSVKHFFTSFSLDKTMHEGWPIFLDDFVDRSPVITDLEGDGLNELIVSDMRTIYVLDDSGQNKEGWPVELEPSWNNGYSVSVGDLDNNGVNEVVVYGATKLYVFNADGSNYPGWPVSLSEPIPVHITSIGYPVIADLDQDGSSEIIISYLAGKVEVFNSDGTYYPGWPKTLKNEFNVDLFGFSPAVGDLDNDGDLEIVVAEQGGTDPKLYVFHHTGELLDGWPKSVGGIWFVPPVLGDIDQDGQLDIIAFSLERNPGEYVESNQLYVWHADGTLMDGWPYALGENRLLGMALADINHDGFPEIITTKVLYGLPPQSKIEVLDHEGNQLWETIEAKETFNGEPLIVDVTGDGNLEVVATFGSRYEGEYSYLSVYDNMGTKIESLSRFVPALFEQAPAIGDLDNDGKFELAVFSLYGQGYVWDFEGEYSAEAAPWPFERKDTMHTGQLLGDLIPPTVPTGLIAETISENIIDVEWNASTDNIGVVEYHVYRDGNLVGSTPWQRMRNYQLEPGTTYSFTVTAIDAAGNESAHSIPVQATTDSGPDTIPPTVPTGLMATTVSSSQIDLVWNASSDLKGVHGYEIYRDGVFLINTQSLNYSDTGLQASTTYSYQVLAYDTSVNRSELSSAVEATTQSDNTDIFVNFVKTDTTTQGNWKGVYGSDGYDVFMDQASYPGYAQVTVTGHNQWKWANSTNEARALQRAGNGRIAAAYYSKGSLTFDVNFTDDQTHQVAIYSLGFDNQARTQKFEVIDAASGAVLDEREITNFEDGTYLVWNIKGHVKIKVSKIGGINATTSGIFFGAGDEPQVDLTPPTVPGNLTALALSENLVHLEWEASSDNIGVAGYNIYRNGSFVRSTIALYQGDWDLQPGTTYSYQVSAFDEAGNESALSEIVQATTHGGDADVVVDFVKTDTTTQGNWKGVYGSDGYDVFMDLSSYPGYAQVTMTGYSQWKWADSTSEERALQRAGSGRIAATHYSKGSLTFDMNFTDDQAHQVAIYSLGFDNRDRTQKFEVIDADTGDVLDEREITNFEDGTYLVWNIKGHVQIKVTKVSGINTATSGIFFDPKP